MTSNPDLPKQPDTIQQPPRINTKSNHSWKSFSILLIIINLFFFVPMIYTFINDLLSFRHLDYALGYALAGIKQSIINISPYIVPLVITDAFAVIAYYKKKAPPWIIFLISLLIDNLTFFYLAVLALNGTEGAVAGLVIFPVTCILLVFDTVVISTYIHARSPHHEAQS